MSGISDLFFVLLFTCITGSVFTVLWMIAGKILEKAGDMKFIYLLLRLVMLGYTVPFAYLFLRIREAVLGTMNGWLFNVTPEIWNIMRVLLIVWVTVAIYHFLHHLIQSLRFGHRENLYLPAELKQREILEELCHEFGIRKKIEVYQCYHLLSPCISGYFRTKIFLPDRKYSEKELRMIFTHELKHYMQKDVIWKPIFTAVKYIYWFNPLAQYAYREMCRWAEGCCDEACSRKFSVVEYFYTIVKLIPKNMEQKKTFVPMWFEEKNELKWRINHIKKYQNKKVRSGTAKLLASAFVVAGVLSACAVSYQAAELYNAAFASTVESEELELPEAPEYEVLEGTEADFAGMDIIDEKESEVATAGTMVVVDWSVPKNTVKRTVAFSKKAGETIKVSLDIEPTTKYVNVGIVKPSGKTSYVRCKGEISYTFNLTETGSYRVYVSNTNDTAVHVMGHYIK